MRTLVVLFAATALLKAQPGLIIGGRVTLVLRDKIEVGDSAVAHVFYSDPSTRVWRGKDYHDFSVLRVGDEVDIRYRIDRASHAVVIDLSANIDKVEGRITHVGGSGFQVDENYNADPVSGYRRGLRQIVYNSGTQWEGSLPEDLKQGRDVFIIGLKLPGGELEASRVTVYEGLRPVRMKPGTRVVMPNGTVR